MISDVFSEWQAPAEQKYADLRKEDPFYSFNSLMGLALSLVPSVLLVLDFIRKKPLD